MEDTIIRKHIRLSGQVQGVGFRYRANRIAQTMGLSGWIKNLPDGQVELEVQGTSPVIDQFLARLHCLEWVKIRRMECETIPCKPEAGFRVAG